MSQTAKEVNYSRRSNFREAAVVQKMKWIRLKEIGVVVVVANQKKQRTVKSNQKGVSRGNLRSGYL